MAPVHRTSISARRATSAVVHFARWRPERRQDGANEIYKHNDSFMRIETYTRYLRSTTSQPLFASNYMYERRFCTGRRFCRMSRIFVNVIAPHARKRVVIIYHLARKNLETPLSRVNASIFRNTYGVSVARRLSSKSRVIGRPERCAPELGYIGITGTCGRTR